MTETTKGRDFEYKTVEVSIEDAIEPVNLDDLDIKQDENTKYIWSYANTCRFLSLIEEHMESFVSKDNKNSRLFWQTIELRLLDEGLRYPSYVCKKKWSNLIRTYKTCRSNIIRFGYQPKYTRFHYYDKMEMLMSKMDKNFQLVSLELTQAEETSEATEDVIDEQQIPFKKKLMQRKRKIHFSDPLSFSTRTKQSYYKAKNDAYKEYMFKSLQIKQQKLNLYKRKIENDERKVQAIEELVQILKQEKS